MQFAATSAALAFLAPLAPLALAQGGSQGSCELGWIPTSMEQLSAESIDQISIFDMARFDDQRGDGTVLFLAGTFDDSVDPGVGIRRWDGTHVTTVPGSPTFRVEHLATHDDGSGEALYAAGDYYGAGGQFALGFARYDGQAWTPLPGVGLNSSCLLEFDDGSGSGPELYLAGSASAIGADLGSEPPSPGLVRWNGQALVGVGGGVHTTFAGAPSVAELVVFDDGSGPVLVVAGSFTHVGAPPGAPGSIAAENLALWDGSSWSTLGVLPTGFRPSELAVYDAGDGPRLHVFGLYNPVPGILSFRMIQWTGSEWIAAGEPLDSNLIDMLTVQGHPVLEDGIYVGGGFSLTEGGTYLGGIARWDGSDWNRLGPGFGGHPVQVKDLALHDDGSGPNLFVGGRRLYSPSGDELLTQWGCAPAPVLELVEGCAGNPTVLVSQTGPLDVGETETLAIFDFAAPGGTFWIMYGVDGADPDGCGLLLPGLGEVLLGLVPDPTIATVVTPSVFGEVKSTVTLPNDPTLANQVVAVQAAHFTGNQASPIELTTALRATIQP
jgi:hypothetical protein